MKDAELKQLLIELAKGDLAEGAELADHPAMLAVDRITRLEEALTPRQWDTAMSEAWHKHLPHTMRAFDALRALAVCEGADDDSQIR